MCTLLFFFKQKTAYEVRINDWSSDVCSSDPLEAVATAKRIFAKGCAIEVLHPRRRYDPGRHPEAAVTALDFVEEARRAKSDRKRVVLGKSVSVRVDLGGRRNLQRYKALRDHSGASTIRRTYIHINNEK